MSERTEVNQEADTIETNRSRCPTTMRLANILFDEHRRKPNQEVEDLAIRVDADAQAGIEYGEYEVRAILAWRSSTRRETGR